MKKGILAILTMTLALPLRAGELKPLESEVMLPGYCRAGSRADDQALGGYASSSNFPKKLADKPLGMDGRISLVAVPTDTTPFGPYQGFRLFLVNRTKTEVAFEASDSRIPIVQEALDEHGKWRPIEYLPSSWCGNSYHRVLLPAGQYWEFAAPKHAGSYKTKLRFVLQAGQPIHSNEFEGSINLQQFLNKEGHRPAGLMDPYNE